MWGLRVPVGRFRQVGEEAVKAPCSWRKMGQGRMGEHFGRVRVWSLHLILKAMERL